MTTPTDSETQALRAAMDRMLEIGPIAEDLMKQGVNPIQAFIMAGDQASAIAATERVHSGGIPLRELYRVGSYARLDWACQHLPHATLLSRFLELWRDSDPDDTKPEFLYLWKNLRWLHRPYPAMDCDLAEFDALPPVLQLYRGQVVDKPLGISWTLNRVVAEKFARTGGYRVNHDVGMVLLRKVRKEAVLGYITQRSEAEVVVDQFDLL